MSSNLPTSNIKSAKRLLIIAAVLGAVGVGIGAIGAHSLPGFLKSKNFEESKIELRLEQCEKAVRYQMYHVLAMLAIGIGILSPNQLSLNSTAALYVIRGGYLMGVGIMLFSGGLYIIVFTEAAAHWIVPFGGISMIIAWIFVAIGAAKIALTT